MRAPSSHDGSSSLLQTQVSNILLPLLPPFSSHFLIVGRCRAVAYPSYHLVPPLRAGHSPKQCIGGMRRGWSHPRGVPHLESSCIPLRTVFTR
ncbi:unnamed protein product [Victoria cruziana]